MDRDDVADNMVRSWTQEAGDASEVSSNLVNIATDLFSQAIVEDDEEEEDIKTIDVVAAIQSEEYKKYVQAAAELEKIDILSLN